MCLFIRPRANVGVGSIYVVVVVLSRNPLRDDRKSESRRFAFVWPTTRRGRFLRRTFVVGLHVLSYASSSLGTCITVSCRCRVRVLCRVHVDTSAVRVFTRPELQNRSAHEWTAYRTCRGHPIVMLLVSFVSRSIRKRPSCAVEIRDMNSRPETLSIRIAR